MDCSLPGSSVDGIFQAEYWSGLPVSMCKYSHLSQFQLSLDFKTGLKVKVSLSISHSMDYTVHGILQARILEWVAFPFSRESSQPRAQTQVSSIAGGFFTSWATREAQEYWSGWPVPLPVALPDPGIEPGSPTLQADSLPTELSGKPQTSLKNPKFLTIDSCKPEVSSINLSPI